MFRSLYSKLAAVVLILFTIIAVLMVVVVVYSTDMYRQEINQKLNLDLAENIVEENVLIRNGAIDPEALEYIFHIMMVINPSIEVYLLDPQGAILEYSAPPGKVKRDRVSLTPIRKMLSGNYTVPLFGDDPRSSAGSKVFSAAAIGRGDTVEGYLYVILGGEAYQSMVEKIKDSFILKMSGWMILTPIIAAVGIGLIIFSLLTRRLEKLTESVRDYHQKVKANIDFDDIGGEETEFSGDEVDNLSMAFKEMKDRIEEQVAKLQEGDLLRRELVAHVSHDLRTPLATLSAYIETMRLNDCDWSEEERHRYLEVVGKHCDRLSSLLDSLFELARLDARETTLKLETFSIAELIQDVVQNYELSAQQKNITLISNIGSDLTHVVGDIGLVERVLENLIANALRYTPEGGEVSIILKPSGHHMSVEVCDTGAGIAEKALPHIFDRFYTVDDIDSDSLPPTGLGLAIAKRIMDLHGSSIEVESTPGEGTCFTFWFPLHNSS